MNQLNKITVFIIFTCMCLPLALQLLVKQDMSELNGTTSNPSDNYLLEHKNLQWLDGTKLKHLELLANDRLSLRPKFIKTFNQFNFSLFNKTSSSEVYFFNNNLFRFYTYNYNESFLFSGSSKIKEKIKKLIALKNYFGDTIPVITLIAPSKTYFYAKDLPKINTLQTDSSNYKEIRRQLAASNLQFIDFNTTFLNWKNKTKTPLFTKSGIHWSMYGANKALDSLVTYFNSISHKNFSHPKWKTKNVYIENYNDDDLALLSNLFFPPFDKNGRSTELKEENKGKKINALIISDSYFDVISSQYLRSAYFTENTLFSYYYSEVGHAYNNSQQINKKDLKSHLKNIDCILILSDIVNLENFGFGFIEDAYNQLVKK